MDRKRLVVGELEAAVLSVLWDRGESTVSEIADALALSVKTISTYRARILEKMGMKTNAELTHYAITHGLS